MKDLKLQANRAVTVNFQESSIIDRNLNLKTGVFVNESRIVTDAQFQSIEFQSIEKDMATETSIFLNPPVFIVNGILRMLYLSLGILFQREGSPGKVWPFSWRQISAARCVLVSKSKSTIEGKRWILTDVKGLMDCLVTARNESVNAISAQSFQLAIFQETVIPFVAGNNALRKLVTEGCLYEVLRLWKVGRDCSGLIISFTLDRFSRLIDRLSINIFFHKKPLPLLQSELFSSASVSTSDNALTQDHPLSLRCTWDAQGGRPQRFLLIYL